MAFVFEGRASESPLVEAIWRTHSEGGGAFISAAASHWEMVVTRQQGAIRLTVRGPETRARLAPIPEDAEFFGIIFKLGTFMPHLPADHFVNVETHLPEAASRSFWLGGAAWSFPTYDNADSFVERMLRQGLLAHDALVDAVLQHDPHDLSLRTVRRRFLHATGLTPKTIQQIERAQRALMRLQQGQSILDTVDELGYFDQAHMTKALKHFVGQTPAQILRVHAAV